MSCANPVSNVCCPPNDNAYAVSDLQEWTLTDLPMPWAYYHFEEGSDTANREDATGQNHDLTSTVLPHPSRVEGLVTPWANQLVSASRFETVDATMNSLEDEWSFHAWLRLTGTPDADNTIFKFGAGTKNQIELRQFWDGVVLAYRLQVGYYAPPDDATPYYNFILLSGLTVPMDEQIFIAASFGGGHMTLQVNSGWLALPALVTDDMNIATITDPFYIGPFTGILGPVGIWTPDNYLTIEHMDTLWANGSGMGLRF